MIPINEDHVRWIMKQWAAHYNKSRPHSSLGPGIPDPDVPMAELLINRHCVPNDHRIVVKPILGGLHHEYQLQRIGSVSIAVSRLLRISFLRTTRTESRAGPSIQTVKDVGRE